MPKYSQIANKTTTTISIDREKLEECRKRRLNLSAFVDEALTREFNPDADGAFNKAVATQNKDFKKYIEDTKQQNQYDLYKYGETSENVVQKVEREQENREDKRNIAAI